MAQQTAMQNLIAWGDEMLLKYPQKILSFAEAIDKAQELLQIEMEQIKETYDVAYQHGCDHKEITSGNIYYNETYKK